MHLEAEREAVERRRWHSCDDAVASFNSALTTPAPMARMFVFDVPPTAS
jgi:hypothetical protein